MRGSFAPTPIQEERGNKEPPIECFIAPIPFLGDKGCGPVEHRKSCRHRATKLS